MTALRRPVLVALAALSLLTAACSSLAPANTPPHLQNTPGVFVVVVDGHVDTGRFRLDFPSSWRLVKESAANAEKVTIALAAPDGGAVTLTEVDPDGEATDKYLRLGNGVMLQIVIDPADDPALAFKTQAEQIIASIRS